LNIAAPGRAKRSPKEGLEKIRPRRGARRVSSEEKEKEKRGKHSNRFLQESVTYVPWTPEEGSGSAEGAYREGEKGPKQ